MRAQDLIKAAGSRPKTRTVPPALLKELKAVLDHNDNAPVSQRVRIEDACKLLVSGGVRCATTNTLQAICREQLGRASWARK